jgi:hypothetical protein
VLARVLAVLARVLAVLARVLAVLARLLAVLARLLAVLARLLATLLTNDRRIARRFLACRLLRSLRGGQAAEPWGRPGGAHAFLAA